MRSLQQTIDSARNRFPPPSLSLYVSVSDMGREFNKSPSIGVDRRRISITGRN